MPRDWHPDDDRDDESDDWDAPPDESDEPEVACRNCGELMLETAPRCPACGDYPSDEESRPSSMPAWVRVLAALLAAVMLWALIGNL